MSDDRCKCDNCVWIRHQGYVEKDGTVRAICKRNPPAVIVTAHPTKRMDIVQTVFPVIKDLNDLCGEHRLN